MASTIDSVKSIDEKCNYHMKSNHSDGSPREDQASMQPTTAAEANERWAIEAAEDFKVDDRSDLSSVLDENAMHALYELFASSDGHADKLVWSDEAWLSYFQQIIIDEHDMDTEDQDPTPSAAEQAEE